MILKVTHNAGFFSCFGVRLMDIIRFFNQNKTLPEYVDSSTQFIAYKDNLNDDLTDIIFKKNDLDIKYIENIKFNIYNNDDQFSDYNEINFKYVNPFIEKYFSPSPIIEQRINYFIKNYNLNLEKTIGVFYRGNDKVSETNIGSYEIYLDKMYQLLSKNPDFKILIQTDDQDFINFCSGKIPFTCFNEIMRIPNNPRHVVHYYIRNKIEFSINFLAVTKIMSMCNILITHSGDCGLWAVLYRQNTNNVSQYLNHNNKGEVWYDSYS